MSEGGPGRQIGRRILKALGLLFLGACALLCIGLGVVLAFTEIRKNSMAGFLLIEALFYGMGSVLIWACYRMAKTPLRELELRTGTVSGADMALSPYAPLMDAYQKDLQKFGEWPKEISPPLFCSEVNGMLERKDFAPAEKRLRDFLDNHPRHLPLQITLLATLRELHRFEEAYVLCEQLTDWEDLSFGAKAILKSEAARCLVLAGTYNDAADACERFLASTDSVIAKTQMLDALASLSHNENRPDYLSEADKWSRRALELAPDFITLKGTRGAVLADLGRFAEAKPLLKDVYEKSESNTDKGIASLYLALCAKAEGDTTNARKLAKQASVIFPQPWLLKRIETEQLA